MRSEYYAFGKILQNLGATTVVGRHAGYADIEVLRLQATAKSCVCVLHFRLDHR